jgi:activator of HSP90 ATPase
MMIKTVKIIQHVFFKAKPMEIYEALVDPKKHTAFTGSKASGEPKVGGKFTAWDDYIFGKFLELKKGEKIVQEWMTTEWPDGYPPSKVEFQIQAKGEGTELTMTHSDVPAEQAENYRQGWLDFYWKPLKEYLGDSV